MRRWALNKEVSALRRGLSTVVRHLDNQFGGHGFELSLFLISHFPFLVSFANMKSS